jgi:TolB protein
MQTHLLTARSAACLLALVTMTAGACADGAEPLSPSAAPAITTAVGGRPHSAPTRGLIAFSHGVTGDREIYTVAEDGSNLRRITFNTGTDHTPSWSPDGKKLAFISHRGEGVEIYSMNRDGSGIRQLTNLEDKTVGIADLAWSPDGRKIAFSAIPNGPDYWEVYVMNASGSGVTRLTNALGDDRHPSWTPDGSRIVYATRFGEPYGAPGIAVMNADGSGSAPMIMCATSCNRPAYAPDGTRLVYSEGFDLRMRNLDNGHDWLFAQDAWGAAWSPDALRLTYTTTAGVVVVTNSDVNSPVPVTQFSGSIAHPHVDWGR